MDELNNVEDNSESFEIMKRELIQKKSRAEEKKDKKALVRAGNDLAMFYFNNQCLDDALKEFEAAAKICDKAHLQMEWATCHRMIAETYSLKANFAKALSHVENYITVAKELKNKVEEQRAVNTIGRIYLLQGQSSTNKTERETSMKQAKHFFIQALQLCEGLKSKIGEKELNDMRARELLNIGVVHEFLGFFDDALKYIEDSIVLCESSNLFEVLHNCYTSQGLLFKNRMKNYVGALTCFKQALEIVDRLEDNKVLKKCETLQHIAEVLCKTSEFKQAKQILLKAWKLKTPSEFQRKEIETNLKVAICSIKEFIEDYDQSDHSNMKKLYEKLGDYASHLKNYAEAVEYYKEMLNHALKAGVEEEELAPIYVSLYQSYKDMGEYNTALEYYDKEYELIKHTPKEAYTTLFSKAEVMFWAKKPYEDIKMTCIVARKHAQKMNNVKYEIRLLKNLLRYQNEYKINNEIEKTKAELMSLGCHNFDAADNLEDDPCSQDDESVPPIGDDIHIRLDILTDEEEETNTEEQQENTENKNYVVKKNSEGDTELHVACVNGNMDEVARLIATGHPVIVRNNEGYTPLHEACNNGHYQIVEFLIDHGADINDQGGPDGTGMTPLFDAICSGHLEVARLLLEKGANPLLKVDTETPLEALRLWRNDTKLDEIKERKYQSLYQLLSDLACNYNNA